MKMGLLVVDMQKIFLHDPKEKLDVREACEHINYVSGLLRGKDQMVIHIQDMEGSNEDTDPEAREFISEITVGPKDIRITKEYSNAFWKTNLEQVLREHEIGFVVVAGFAAEYCVTFTANGAMERGFQAAILQRGIVSTKPDAINSIYRDRHIISWPAIQFMMNTIV
ncbi:isochorismatase family protein [Paenibacillus sp. GP183]|jgi:nicotinamidase-related amidase|uniref:cysteine hydrolase family protein n=1 Tax=Paenibacillus sp. GP183 TaxID=1882751 RepID=UPI0008976FD4|nr:isochorismatase family protein [Paenibacillus sp. GP183]SEC26355.1 Nicotinamidase-related amidase [Paenibacillus sp. GP183]